MTPRQKEDAADLARRLRARFSDTLADRLMEKIEGVNGADGQFVTPDGSAVDDLDDAIELWADY